MSIANFFKSIFPKNSICVLTRTDLADLIKIELSMAWKASFSRAKKCENIAVISIDDFNRGKYFIAKIKEVISMADIKRNKCIHTKFPEIEAHEYAAFRTGSTFYGMNKNELRDGDERLIIIFDDIIERGIINEEFKSGGGVVFYT